MYTWTYVSFVWEVKPWLFKQFGRQRISLDKFGHVYKLHCFLKSWGTGDKFGKMRDIVNSFPENSGFWLTQYAGNS